MKYLSFALFVLTATVFYTPLTAQTKSFDGAWSLKGSDHNLLLIQDGYFSWTETNDQDEFVNTLGGELEVKGNELDIEIEFNAGDRSLVGESFETPYTLVGNVLTTRHPEGYELTWERIPEKDQGLAGVWRISGRKSEGEMKPIGRSPRKTYKLLTPEHFQWIAMNEDTGEFFGTGGGTYTFKDGKYTEHIEFFSRDNSKVGMSLTFDGELKNGDWHHSGKSSKGDPIYEVWSRETEY